MRNAPHLTLVLVLLAFPTKAAGQITFVNVQEAVGLNFIHQSDGVCPNPPIGSGSAWADYDDDGDIDLYLTSMGGESRLFQNQGDTNGDGLPDFLDVAPSLGVAFESWTAGVVFVDYDNDGDQDLYVTRWGGNYLFQNRLSETGSATFLDVTSFAEVGDADRANTAAWADFDQDGWLDLYIAKHFDCMPNIRESRDALLRNRGDGTFENVSQYLCADGSLTCDQLNLGHAFTAAWFDYDNDSDPDLYVANDVVAAGYPNILWRNDGPDGTGGWIFTDVSEESGADYSISSMGLGIGDFDNDGWIDIASGHAQGGFLIRNRGDMTFEDVSVSSGTRAIWTPEGNVAIPWSTPFADFDNDQWLDLVHVRGMVGTTPTPQPDALFHNNHNGTFTDISEGSGMNDPSRARSASMADFNEDGFIDLFVGNYADTVALYFNQGLVQGNQNHWLEITAEGSGSVNRDAIGARFFLTTSDGITQIREITSGPTHGGGDHKRVHFGMGENVTGTLSVRWPGGETQNLGEVDADQYLHISSLTGVSDHGPIVSRFELLQNYPNPFNGETKIGFQIADYGFVSVKVYDVLGREVATVFDGAKEAGSYSIAWDAGGFPSGVYYYRMNVRPSNGTGTGAYVQTRKLTLIK